MIKIRTNFVIICKPQVSQVHDGGFDKDNFRSI